MPNTLIEILWPALLGIACGAITFAVLKRRHEAARSAKTARCMLSAPEVAQMSVPLDTHLCLNVLGRFAIALDGDESAQIGMEHLGDYLAACHRAALARDGERLAHVRQVVDRHAALACWRAGRDGPAVAWHASGDIATQQGMVVLINALQHLLSSQEGSAAQLHLHVDIATESVAAEPGGQQQVATLRWSAGTGHEANQRAQRSAGSGTLFVRWPVKT
jgi:hypothetical protein